jgi:hypothetical protein
MWQFWSKNRFHPGIRTKEIGYNVDNEKHVKEALIQQEKLPKSLQFLAKLAISLFLKWKLMLCVYCWVDHMALAALLYYVYSRRAA